MNKAKTLTIEIVKDRDTRKVIFRVFVSMLIVLSIVYAYLIGAITFNILARKSLESTVLTLSSKVSNLELTYLNSTNKIDKSYAMSLGFVDAKNNIFITRNNTDSVAIR
ncbi:MAG: hypothetical protein KGI58_02180 [Patescibacteria group bacterium]|nr:hypothetical protein [Patescibacteria group bacterium]